MNICLRNITKQYEDTLVLNQVNLEIKEGKITCIMGPSGIGKTTLIHIIMGVVKADSGILEGLKDKRITAVFQEDRLCEGVGAIHNVKMVCDKKVSELQIKQDFNEVGLLDYENKKIRDLSGGMKRRVAMVRAVMAESDIIIMDEPFKGLDDKLKEQVIHYIKRKTKDRTLIVVTHNREEVEALGGELIVLGKSMVIEDILDAK
ncbi:MAG: ATP-binding cassette domain-containing protein [Anaerocolumna sp.]